MQNDNISAFFNFFGLTLLPQLRHTWLDHHMWRVCMSVPHTSVLSGVMIKRKHVFKIMIILVVVCKKKKKRKRVWNQNVQSDLIHWDFTLKVRSTEEGKDDVVLSVLYVFYDKETFDRGKDKTNIVHCISKSFLGCSVLEYSHFLLHFDVHFEVHNCSMKHCAFFFWQIQIKIWKKKPKQWD